MDLQENQIRDLSPLTGLKKLQRLELWRNQIRDISPLIGLTNLTGLFLSSNQIRDITPLAGLTKLRELGLGYNKPKIRDITPLTKLTKLEWLRLVGNQIRDVTPLAKLVNLNTLYLNGNPVQDTSPLASLTKLRQVDIDIHKSPVVHISAAQRPPMYWVNEKVGTIHRLVGADVENLLPSVKNAMGLVLNPADNKIYWTEQVGKNRGRVKSANLDGSNVQVLANIKGGVPGGIAIDPTQGKLYWTDSRGRIQRANLNGKGIRNLIRNLKSPENITVDVAGGKLYWTENSGRIRRANLNGKSIEDIASDLGSLTDIAISGNQIYWTEITGESSGRIGQANLNGSNFRTFIWLHRSAHGIAIDTVGRKIYWTDSAGKIMRLNLKAKHLKEVVSNLTSPIDLAVGNFEDQSAAAPANNLLTPPPEATQLLVNYPNPFNPETWIPYQLAKPADVTISIYAANGQVVRRLALGHQPVGIYQDKNRAAYWDGRNGVGEPVASGVYFYTLTAGDFSATRKMLIRK